MAEGVVTEDRIILLGLYLLRDVFDGLIPSREARGSIMEAMREGLTREMIESLIVVSFSKMPKRGGDAHV